MRGMRYTVAVSPAAQRNLRRIRPEFRQAIETAIYGLSENPRPRGSLKLRGQRRTWRLRVGGFRVIYEIRSETLVVTILKVVRRNETAYR